MKNLLTLLLLMLHMYIYAQLQRNYTSYTVDNGLAQNTVWDAFQDYKGFMWFSTADGMNRFDGYKMQHYHHDATETHSIFGTTGFNFYEDSNQTLWIGHDRGLSLYDRIHNTFNNFYKNANGISIMGTDDAGLLWVVSAAKYLYAFDKTTLQLKHTVFINQSWHNSYGSIISSIQIGNTFYIGFAKNVLLQFNAQSLAYKPIHIQHNFGSTLHRLSTHKFCSFYKSIATICTVVNDSLVITFKKYAFADTAELYFSGGTLYNNKLYAGGQAGLYIFNTSTLDLEDHITSFTNKPNDSYVYIQTVRKDNNNNLLICTNGAGVYIYSPYKNKFKHYTNNSPKKSLFKAIVATKNGTIYGGSYAEGITVFNPNGTYSFIQPQINDQLRTVHGICKISDNELMYASDRELILLNTNTQTQKKLPVDKTYYATAYPYFQKNQHQIWLNRNNTTDAAIFDVVNNTKILTLRNNTICCFKKAADSLVWIGTKKGLLVYNLRTHQYKPTAITGFVKSILIASSQKIYVGTIVGLYVINKEGQIEQHYTTANQLKNNFIYGVLEDNYHHIWFSHNRGISKLTPESGNFKHYGLADGLQSNEFNTGAYYIDEKGLLYFGGVNGINVINPAEIIENKNPPPIGINEILLDDLPFQTDSSYNEIKSLNLSYLQNTLSFDFSALEFSQPENNTYRYKMEGYDNNWIESGNKHFARYANLPPGTYVFKINAANSDGVWNETPRELSVTITPPFWQRVWFYWSITLLGLGFILALLYLYINRQKARLQRELEIQQKLEQERLRISRDLHDNVGAQLSYLITNVEWMLEHPDQVNKEEEKTRLQTLSETGRNAILTLRQTIWAISHNSLTVDDFADRFKQFALKMVAFNKEIQLHFTENFESTKTLSPAVALNLFRICQEAFNNSLKHANCKTIHIEFTNNTLQTFVFSIVDDGVGFEWDEALNKGHYGLHNMKARAQETDATLTIQSEKGKGTTLILSVK